MVEHHGNRLRGCRLINFAVAAAHSPIAAADRKRLRFGGAFFIGWARTFGAIRSYQRDRGLRLKCNST